MPVHFVRRVFIYEYFTGGGTYSDATATSPEGCIVGEGAAMVTALACDFQAIPGTEVVVLRDARLPDWPTAAGSFVAIHTASQERDVFAELARQCDATVIIAPEQNQALLERTRWAETTGARLLCPDSEFVAIASDKNRTADLLGRHGVPVPAGLAFQPGTVLPSSFCYPAVLKPADGAGSIGVQRMDDPASPYDAGLLGPSARLETLCPGVAASIAVLCGPGGPQTLPPCLQRLSEDGHFRYLGGSAPIEAGLAERAKRLARVALTHMPATQGYVGIDLVLGSAEDGSADVVVEINPRLTTSYVGLRQLLKTNLAAAMIEVAAGRPVDLCLARQRVEFTADGRTDCG
jgi:predicted ATP-grasp superfamily ATP-dependent carboligase